MLLYSILHLAGVKEANKNTLEILNDPAVRLEDIKSFRQLGSRCPGHPESHLTTGIETTTGPLGQGYANSVGMALAGRWLASRYNQPGFEDIYNFNVYALGGDGCMMEGIASETASPSKEARRWPSPKTWPRDSPPTAGTSRTPPTRTIWK
jgi:transketolase